MKKGVKPKEISEMGAKAVQGELPACDLDRLKSLEENFAHHLLTTPPQDNFTVEEVKNFEWKPVLKNDFKKTDVLNKNKEKCNQ